MFTGIIEAMGKIEQVIQTGGNKTFWISSPISAALKTDQSVCHNGVCLTVEAVDGEKHRVTAIEETLSKTNLQHWLPGSFVNLERCLQMNGRLDGHIVQGHVDGTALCTGVTEKNGSWGYDFRMDNKFGSLVIEKGSIALNGTSLTIFNVTATGFTVAIIPYTFEHTVFKFLQKGDTVNLEFDMIGKYVNRLHQLQQG